jgi:hypothetical protein
VRSLLALLTTAGFLACTSLDGLSKDAVPENGDGDAAPSAEGGAGDAQGRDGCVGASCVPAEDCRAAGLVECGGTCVDVTTDKNHCGSCAHSCLGDACAGGHCASVALNSALSTPTAVRSVGPNVYVLQSNGVVRIAKTGGTATPLFTTVTAIVVKNDPFALAVDGSYAYFLATSNGGAQKNVYRCALGGCFASPQPLVAYTIFQPFAITADATTIAWSATYGKIEQCTAATCTTATQLAPPQDGKQQVVLTTDFVVWANDFNRSIYRCTRVGCVDPTELVGSTALKTSPGPLQVFADKVYFATRDPKASGVYRCAVAGCGGVPELIANVPGLVSSLAVDADGVYWTVPGGATTSDGGIYACTGGKPCATPTVLASARPRPMSLTIDAARVYWVESGASATTGVLRSVAR